MLARTLLALLPVMAAAVPLEILDKLPLDKAPSYQPDYQQQWKPSASPSHSVKPSSSTKPWGYKASATPSSHPQPQGGKPQGKDYYATFENLPEFELDPSDLVPQPYQGLDFYNLEVMKNPLVPVVTNIETPQGDQYVGQFEYEDSVYPVIAVPDTQVFSLHSAFVGIASLDKDDAFVAQTGVLTFTGTKMDGSTVVETVEFDANLLVATELAETKFTKLDYITTLTVTAASEILSVVNGITERVLDTDVLAYVELDGLKYTIFEKEDW